MNVMDVRKVNIADALAGIERPWHPSVAADLNGQQVKLAKMLGEFPWHTHTDADELFLVVEGAFRLELRGRTLEVARGEFVVVPRGLEHRPVAEREAHVLLFEPAGTVNTGADVNEFTTLAERI
jgi:mannose-6-phosphate isomerase-like protein (cupin superfamily)